MKKQKKIPKNILENRRKGRENEEKILHVIINKESTVSEIKNKTTFSIPTITKHLRNMENKKLVDKKVVYEKSRKKIIYHIAENALLNITGLKIYKMYLDIFEKSKATLYRDYSQLETTMIICNLPWGIQSNLIADKKLEKLGLLEQSDVEEIEKSLFNKIKDNIEYVKEHEIKYRKESLALLDAGKLILSFEIDLKKIHESIKKNSLEKLENMPPEKIDELFEKELME